MPVMDYDCSWGRNQSLQKEVVMSIADNIIAERIGKIFDPAFLKIVPNEKIRDIALIQVHNEIAKAKADLAALESVAKSITDIKVQK